MRTLSIILLVLAFSWSAYGDENLAVWTCRGGIDGTHFSSGSLRIFPEGNTYRAELYKGDDVTQAIATWNIRSKNKRLLKWRPASRSGPDFSLKIQEDIFGHRISYPLAGWHTYGEFEYSENGQKYSVDTSSFVCQRGHQKLDWEPVVVMNPEKSKDRFACTASCGGFWGRKIYQRTIIAYGDRSAGPFAMIEKQCRSVYKMHLFNGTINSGEELNPATIRNSCFED